MTAGLLDGLNERQIEAVTAGMGPMLVLAGPGSGKTRILTHRIAHLISQMKVNPYNIVAVTFTNKAASEMRSRVENLLEGRLQGLQIGTFHATCARLLRREWQHTPYGSDYLIFDSDDQISVITQALKDLNIDSKRWKPRRILGAISNAKNELIGPDKLVAGDYFEEIVVRAYQRYQAVLLDNNALDFDDLLMQMVILLQENAAVCEKYQRLFDFVLVDEFQDTNMAQYELVKLLAAPQNNVFVVGDEDQSIYAFRGADYRNVLQFRKDYAEAKVILLEQNYRSTQIVLDAARAVIDKNSHRTPKALFTDRTSGPQIVVHEAYNESYEAEFITGQIDMLRRDLYDYRDFAMMYRTNAQSRALEEACIQQGIPYRLIGGVGFYKRREVRDLLAYLRLVNNANDKVSFARIINVPKRGIGQKSLQDFQYWAAQSNLTYDEALDWLIQGGESPLSARPTKLFANFGRQLFEWRKLAQTGNLVELFDDIMAQTRYTMYLHDISDTEEQAIDRSENVRELRGLVAAAEEVEEPLAEFLEAQSLVSDVDQIDDDENTVTLLTLHSAKGLEYPVVFITGLEEGLLPHSRSFDDPDGMEEERRLMYVGLTRAKDRVFLSYAFRRSMFGNSMTNMSSRFLGDIPPGLIEGNAPLAGQKSSPQPSQTNTTWEPSRLERDLQTAKSEREENKKIRGKIIPFSAAMSGRKDPDLRYTSGMRVQHPIYGNGVVVESKWDDGDEEVTVAFESKEYGIKRLIASFANLVDLGE
jgi:DNA helicase II / ATP-dependent DNA helicase PcrA